MKKMCLFVCLVFFSFIFVPYIYADTIKMKNGSYFEGKIIEDTGPSLRMQMAVGVVDFQKAQIEEVVHADFEENMELERSWKGELPEDDTDEETLIENYLHKDKVKYQGRWISQEVYDVIQRDKDIKAKRYKFMRDKEKREERLQQEILQDTVEAQSEEIVPELKGARVFGTRRTKAVASVEEMSNEDEGAADISGLKGVRRLSKNTKSFAKTHNQYSI